MTRVVVVGGGIAGLAAAHSLSTAGVDVTIVEGSRDVGGKLRVSDIAGVPVDEGAESFVRRRPEGLAFAAALGMADSLVSPVPLGAQVWSRGELRPMPAATVLGVPSDPATLAGVLSPAEVRRVRLDRWLPGNPPEADIAVGAWIGRRLGRAVVDRLVDPLLGGVYAGRADELSLAATLPQLPRGERSALVAAGRAIAAAPPAGEPVFATYPGGLGTLPGAVADAITAGGGSLITGRLVRRIERTESGWRVIHGSTTDERSIAADAVVLAVPAAPAARLLRDAAPVAAAELAGIEAASVTIVTTAWRRDDAPAAASSGYLVPAVYQRAVKAVTLSSAKWAHLKRDGIAVVRCSIGRHGDVSDLQRDDADLVSVAVEELTSYAGFAGRPVESRVSRWGGGLPQYAVGHLDRVARIRAAVAAVPGLAVCGASYDGVGVPACIATGRQAAATVLTGVTTRGAR
jgi:oxygen-dependent protoporphyrinogen oxidase